MPTLAQVVPSLAAGLGVSGFANALHCPEIAHGVVCLIDGLGADALSAHGAAAPTLASRHADPITTVLPSTTPTALASLGTGLPPGGHGIVGAAFLLDDDRVLAPLTWGSDPAPLAVQPERTLFETLTSRGVRVTTVAAAAYERSGLTRAALRGATYRPVEDVSDRCRALIESTAGAGPSLTYVYWPDLDRTGHMAGVGSEPWLRALADVDDLVRRLAECLPDDAAMIVTSDHGMVNCDRRVNLDARLDLLADVDVVAGEPRFRHVYAAPGRSAAVAERWRAGLAGQATVMTREEIVDRGLLGPVDEFIAERIGDVVAIAEDTVSIASSVDPLVSSLIGQHGGRTAAELEIPACWFGAVDAGA